MSESHEMQMEIFRLCVAIILITMLVESAVMFVGPAAAVPAILIGRILGWFEGMSMMAGSYWLSTSHSSAIKNGLVNKVASAVEKKP